MMICKNCMNCYMSIGTDWHYCIGLNEKMTLKSAETTILENCPLGYEREIHEMKVIKDGNSWAYVLPNFENLQVSPSIWTEKDMTNELNKIYNDLLWKNDKGD